MTSVRPSSSLGEALQLFGKEVPPLLSQDGRDPKSPRLARLGSTMGSQYGSSNIDLSQLAGPNVKGSVSATGLPSRASLGLYRTASSTARVTLCDVPTLLFAALLKKLHEQQRGRPLDDSDSTIVQEAEEAYNRRSMLQRIMLGGDHRIQAVSFFQEALLHRLPTSSLRVWQGTIGQATPRSQGAPSSRTTASTMSSQGGGSSPSAPRSPHRKGHQKPHRSSRDPFDYHPFLRGPTPRELTSMDQPTDLDAIPPARRPIFKHLLDAPGQQQQQDQQQAAQTTAGLQRMGIGADAANDQGLHAAAGSVSDAAITDTEIGDSEARSHPAVPRLRLRPLSDRSPLWYRRKQDLLSPHRASPDPDSTNSQSPPSSQPTPGTARDPLGDPLRSPQSEQHPASLCGKLDRASADMQHQHCTDNSLAGSSLLCGPAMSACRPLEKLKVGRGLRRLLLVAS
ncbi:hypothetical protein WJX84_008261 [Apatococcus fuscideae]|uniref:Uncharacterized protein n=1 Tax=Apatococcus fuscideae TaxID=2026836 RepID=A0AAW1SWA5_9CHLO